MIRITSNERKYLLKNGCKQYRDIHSTGNHHNDHSYATENARVLGLLKDLYGCEVNRKMGNFK